MSTVMRYDIADFLDTGTTTPSYALMGVGFNSLDESPNAQKDSKTYIHQKSQTSTIKGYQTAFAFDTDLISSDTAVMKLYDIGRNQKTGADAELDYVRVELFKPVPEEENRAGRRAGDNRRQLCADAGNGGSGRSLAGDVRGCRDRAAGDGEHHHHDYRADTGGLV